MESTRIGGPRVHELLIKELDERHQYARVIGQGYVAWYTFFVTSNFTSSALRRRIPTRLQRFGHQWRCSSFLSTCLH